MTAEEPTSGSPTLNTRVKRGLAWSALNNMVVRLVGLGVGILLARLLTPADFGVYAVALTVQLILVTVAELGISADLIRRGRIEERGPTVATIGLAASAATTVIMVILAGPVATLLGSSSATPVVQVMSLTLILSGLSIVPYAVMQREFMQSQQLLIDGSSLVLSTLVTVAFIFAGAGPMSLAYGRIAAQTLTLILQFAITRLRPRFGWDREIAREVLSFGIPIAGANLLSWVILNVDNMLVGHNLGAIALGFYVLAFNLSSWPMNAVGLTVRTVALPAFARLQHDLDALRVAFRAGTALTAALATPLGVLLIILAGPLVNFLYGAKWSASAAVLTALGAFGIVRVVFDLFVAFLYSCGRSRGVLWVQVVWLAGLAPAMAVGIKYWGLVGAGWAHVIIGVAVLLPAYLVALSRAGIRPRTVGLPFLIPLLASIPAAVGTVLVTGLIDPLFPKLAAGGLTFAALYIPTMLPWLLAVRRRLRESPPAPPLSEDDLRAASMIPGGE